MSPFNCHLRAAAGPGGGEDRRMKVVQVVVVVVVLMTVVVTMVNGQWCCISSLRDGILCVEYYSGLMVNCSGILTLTRMEYCKRKQCT